MLHRFLVAIQNGEVQSLFEIARALGISSSMALHMAQELTRRGYLEEIGSDCASTASGCPDCPAHSACQPGARHWFLTEKGRAVAQGAALPR